MQYHWRFRRAFLNKMSPTVNIIAIFDLFFEWKVTLIARWRYHWCFRRAFSNKMSPSSWNYCDFQQFLLFRNKARNAGRSGENAGMRQISQNAGFPARLQDGWHLCNYSMSFVFPKLMRLPIVGVSAEIFLIDLRWTLVAFNHRMFPLVITV